MDAIKVTVVAVIVVIAATISVIIGVRRRVPILELNETDPHQVSECRQVVVDDLMRLQVQRRAPIMFFLRFQDGRDHLIRHEVRMCTPRGDEHLALVIRIGDRLRVRELRHRTGRA
jgi:hypothetical protein